MRLAANADDVVHVVLSERNLLSLLHKAGWEGSHRTLTKRERVDGPMLIVTVEPDADHYADREPGVMHSETERFIRAERATQVGNELAALLEVPASCEGCACAGTCRGEAA